MAVADIQIAPDVVSIVPRFRFQELDGVLEVEAVSNFTNYWGVAPDYTLVNVTRVATNELVSTTNVTYDSTITASWNSTIVQEGSYTVSYESWKGKTGRRATATVNISRPQNSGVNVTEYQTYGSINDSLDYKLYRIKHPSGCANWFNITLTGRNGHDVDLYIKEADPANAGSTNSTYTIQNNTAASFEYNRWENVNAGQIFTVMVRQKSSTLAKYDLRWIKDCGGGGGGEPQEPPLVDRLETWEI